MCKNVYNVYIYVCVYIQCVYIQLSFHRWWLGRKRGCASWRRYWLHSREFHFFLLFPCLQNECRYEFDRALHEVRCHYHPSMLNRPDDVVYARVELNMKAVKRVRANSLYSCSCAEK